MFDEADIIEIQDTQSGDVYFYEVPVHLDGVLSFVDIQRMIDEILNEALP